jgi:hypothetical protein
MKRSIRRSSARTISAPAPLGGAQQRGDAARRIQHFCHRQVDAAQIVDALHQLHGAERVSTELPEAPARLAHLALGEAERGGERARHLFGRRDARLRTERPEVVELPPLDVRVEPIERLAVAGSQLGPGGLAQVGEEPGLPDERRRLHEEVARDLVAAEPLARGDAVDLPAQEGLVRRALGDHHGEEV